MKKIAGIVVALALAAGCTWLSAAACKRAAWENGGRAAVLKWFGENQFGVTPIGRPADEVIGERSVTFANGTIKIDIHVSLPEGSDQHHHRQGLRVRALELQRRVPERCPVLEEP